MSSKVSYRTNFFDFWDKKLLGEICDKYDVSISSNMKGVALICKNKEDLVKAIKEAFNNNVKVLVKNDVVFVNL